MVFATTELLERILLCLPPRDMIVAMRVSKAWNACVHSSPSAITHLFIRHSGLTVPQMIWRAGQRDIGQVDNDGDDEGMFATIGLAPEDTSTIDQPPTDSFLDGKNSTILLTPVRVCPLLRLISSDEPAKKRLRDRVTEYFCFDALFRPIDRWKAMLLTDPPCTKARVSVHFQHDEKNIVVAASTTVLDDGGLTIQEVVESIMLTPDRVHYYHRV